MYVFGGLIMFVKIISIIYMVCLFSEYFSLSPCFCCDGLRFIPGCLSVLVESQSGCDKGESPYRLSAVGWRVSGNIKQVCGKIWMGVGFFQRLL